MNYEDFKQIIEEIQENIVCRECKAQFNDRDIRIIGTVFNEGYFITRCRDCKNRMIINVILKTKKRAHRQINKRRFMKNVTQDDVLDMRNFLKEFDGNFIHLFQTKK
ncbi:MAG: hypothetical protein Q8P27_02400 [Candidatus Peregrinibacteria bacterium]|nr:hypothetical protein [Candidatus Peregrinibacteria bacterium]